MSSFQSGIGGGLSGAASGAAIGSVVPGIGTGIGAAIGGGLGLLGGLDIFGGGDDAAQQQYQQQLDLYKQLLQNYRGPESDPGYQAQLAGLGQMANGGLSDADKAGMLSAYSQGNQLAQGREGAIGQQMMMRGGGVASSGQQAALQQQAAQDAAMRAQQAGMGQAGIAANRALQARQIYMNQVQNNSNAMNEYRLRAASGLNGAYGNMANFQGARGEAGNMALQNGLGNLADVGMYMYGQRQKQRPQGGGGDAGGGMTNAIQTPGDGSYGGNY